MSIRHMYERYPSRDVLAILDIDSTEAFEVPQFQYLYGIVRATSGHWGDGYLPLWQFSNGFAIIVDPLLVDAAVWRGGRDCSANNILGDSDVEKRDADVAIHRAFELSVSDDS
ncbi:hypothetical protein CUC08_Gglean013228 [Alternaria sp. MG1]|jgi:hypothetical protein|nr:hypothetical protein CUC08_Gglean013228 [Alternaria sp. MG1]